MIRNFFIKNFRSIKDRLDINFEPSQISDEIISTMRKYLIANVPDCSLQIQEADINLPDIINKYLVIEIELTDQVKNDILKFIPFFSNVFI